MKQPRWIWSPDGGRNVNQYVEFRREFTLAEDACEGAELCLGVDSNFVAWVNGERVGAGQFSDFPDSKTFSRMDVGEALVPGRNVLSVLVHYCGIDHFSYIPGTPGLWFSLRCGEAEVVSDDAVQCRPSPAYRQGEMPRITIQMGFTFEYDARNNDDWIAAEYLSDDSWTPVGIVSGMSAPEERPLPMLVLKPSVEGRIVGQGRLNRCVKDDATVAQLMQCDEFSDQGEDGTYIILDLGREECGFVDLDIDAATGSVVDIAVGEHLVDQRVRASVGARNFASRYIAKEGRQRFTHYANRYAGRYVELHITQGSESFMLHHAGLIPADYPLNMRGAFNCPNEQMNRIYDISQRTMHLCMHEHYEDCPWREQALYANDSRIQALAGYYAFGEYDFPSVSFDLLAQTLGDDGYQEMCAPMKFDFTIPSFSMSWFLAIADHLRFSGDVEAARQQLPRMRAMIDAYHATFVDDLMPSPPGSRYWHFYDWADGLSNEDLCSKPGSLTALRFDAPLNFFFVLAARAAAEIAEACGENEFAAECRLQATATTKAAHAKFWCETEQAYATYVDEQVEEKHFAELIQALALISGAPDDETARALRSRLAQPDNGWVATTLSQSLYKFEALLADRETFAMDVFSRVTDEWGFMLEQGATSFWETIKGEADFDGAGSLCHGWSALPAYLYQAYLLGVRPTSPGFSTFEVDPFFGVVSSASGEVGTPFGPICVEWEKSVDGYAGRVVHPENLKPLALKGSAECHWTVEIDC